MTFRQTMTELKALGTAQNRKVYARHGVKGDLYGVSYANLGKLRRKIKTDHKLALHLWASGNHEARVLATMVADTSQLKAGELDQWASDCGDYVTADVLASLVSKTSHAHSRIAKWTRSRSEFVAAAGWATLANVVTKSTDFTNAELKEYLKYVEANIHSAKNRVRHSMNNALIAIALSGPQLERLARAAAKRIGPVEVDHGETGCKTPEAVPYIDRAVARRTVRQEAADP